MSAIYESINVITGINKNINLMSFNDTEIVLANFDLADERFKMEILLLHIL